MNGTGDFGPLKLEVKGTLPGLTSEAVQQLPPFSDELVLREHAGIPQLRQLFNQSIASVPDWHRLGGAPSASPRSWVAVARRTAGTFARVGGNLTNPQRACRLTAHTEWLSG